MKKKYLYISLALVLSAGLYSCDDDDAPLYPEENDELVEVSDDKSGITVSSEKIDIIKGQTKTFEITAGAGDYRLSVLDKTVAEAAIEGNIVTVKSLAQGKTDIILSDSNGGFKSVKVDVYLTDNLVADVAEVSIELPFGKPSEKIITVTEGNGGYEVSSANSDIATVAVDGTEPSKIRVSSSQEGETQITITDSHGLTLTLPVKVTVNNSAFSQAELEEIMAKTDKQCVLWPDKDFVKKGASRVAINADLKSEINLGRIGLKHTGVCPFGNSENALTVAFESDINYEVDKEETGFLYIKEDYSYGDNDKYKGVAGCKFKVIKKDGDKLWAVFYVQIGEEMVKGYMILPI